MEIRQTISNVETYEAQTENNIVNLIDDSDISNINMNSMRQASTKFLEQRKSKARQLLEIQDKNFNEWSKKDLKFRWKLSCHFAPKEITPSDFEYLSISDKDQLPKIEKTEWKMLKKDSIVKHNGLNLASRLYILTRPINIRSQSLKLDIEFMLAADSQFNLISRSLLLTNKETAIFRFTRIDTRERQRLFVILAAIDSKTREVVLITKTEIPILKQNEDGMHIALTCIDSGSDLIVLSGIINKNLRNAFRVVCDRLIIPYLEEFNLMFYGYGLAVIMKSFELNVVDRVNSATFKRNGDNSSCCYAQCKIF